MGHDKGSLLICIMLYNPNEQRDNCGFGLIAHMDGEASHELVQTATTALSRLTHRGAIAADGKTGDGCGLLLQLPKDFFQAVASSQHISLPEQFGVGVAFFSPFIEDPSEHRQAIESSIEDQNLQVVGWRTVPVQKEVCGEQALARLPHIEHFFVAATTEITTEAFERVLFFARKAIERHDKSDDIYIPSLSTRTILYKGLVMPENLAEFYPDLQDPEMKSAICVFHQRFSTNTLPDWRLAQPFRFLAHNGEINTIRGNRNWSAARAKKFQSEHFPDTDALAPIVDQTGSDSASLDNMLELLLMGGMPLYSALRLLTPPAWQNVQSIDFATKAMFEYHALHMEPWDGPAGIVLTDGRYAVCTLDRNGLRPARYVMTKNRYITLASEIGVYDYAPEEVVEKGRLGPGQIVSVDTETGEFLTTRTIDDQLKNKQPYRKWLRAHATRIHSRLVGSTNTMPIIPPEEYQTYFKLFQLTFEERDQILRPLGETGQEPVASMGDDTPMAVLSRKVRPLYDYFRQLFAQVTNPPIDPLRENIVMSLETYFGRQPNVFETKPESAKRIILDSPVLSLGKYTQLMQMDDPDYQSVQLSLSFKADEGLKPSIETLCRQAVDAARDGATIIILSDWSIAPDTLPIPAALATGAVHHALINADLRCDTNIIVETATARNAHHFAVLIGYGATAVYPYLAYECYRDLKRTGELSLDPTDAIKLYRRGIEKALLKVLSKMGIATISSYRGAELFEVIGLHEEVTQLCFPTATSRIQGAKFSDIENDLKTLSKAAWQKSKSIETGGLLKFMHGSEYHAYNPDVVTHLIQACRQNSRAQYDRYAALVNNRPIATIRDCFQLKTVESATPIDKVESADKLYPRFDSAGMSLGALSPEAHEALAIAMGRLGGRSNSGEGGEDPARYGTEKTSKIKQVASGRFGVTPEYLVNAEVIQIKIAQGAKPGEGGQLPGHKVTPLIARLRYSVPGVTLISPPPHHDIYSIEDLAQLIFDLKQVNPTALISVKLVSEPGVGTIAVGVAKAYADLITISGYDGGTAASPLSSIKYAGSPWEMGLAETHQALVTNGLRHKIRLQTDGGLKTGLDVVKAAILGAESFGFGTAPMVALGCKYLRICHLNNCATGVATQNEHLRKSHFVGLPDMAMNFFQFVAEETRQWLAKLGVEKLEEVIGRTELLEWVEGQTDKQRHLDLSDILAKAPDSSHSPFCTEAYNAPFDKGELAEKIQEDTALCLKGQTGGIFHYPIRNHHRSIGAKLSGAIAQQYGNQGMARHPIKLHFKGSAGQSFGVWNAGGLHLHLEGDANDYVGKGMTGGKIVINPPPSSAFDSQTTPIVGNTCLYGATGGEFFAAGTAGERFAVRNSGATGIVEGLGDHGCEYMTGGLVVSLGPVGHNFGAGMTGGFAYVLDLDNSFVDRYNNELIDIHRINILNSNAHHAYLRNLIEHFANETHSIWGQDVLDSFEDYLRHFWLVKPKAASFDSLLDNLRIISA